MLCSIPRESRIICFLVGVGERAAVWFTVVVLVVYWVCMRYKRLFFVFIVPALLFSFVLLAVATFSPLGVWFATVTNAIAQSDTTPPTVIAAETKYYADSTLSTVLANGSNRKAGQDIYTKVKFSENVVTPRLWHLIGFTTTGYNLVAHDATLSSGECKPKSSTDTSEYTCRYTTASNTNGVFRLVVDGASDQAGNTLTALYSHSDTLTLDSTPATVAQAPTGLSVSPGTDGTSLAVSWAAVGTATDWDVAYSRIFLNTDRTAYSNYRSWRDAGHTGTTPSHTITGLRNGDLYAVRVRAADGSWTQEVQGRPLSSNARLSTLSAQGYTKRGTSSALTLAPAFDANTTTYTTSVGHSVTSVKLSFTLAGPCAYTNEGPNGFTYTGWCPMAESGKRGATRTDADSSSSESTRVALTDGDTVIDVVVTSQDGTTTNTYTVTVTRESATQTDTRAYGSPFTAPTSFTLTPGESKLAVSWGAPILGDRELLSYTLRYKRSTAPDADGAGNPAQGWVTQSFGISYGADAPMRTTIGSLRNLISYDVQVRARARSTADGVYVYSPWATGQATPVFEPVSLSDLYTFPWTGEIPLREIDGSIGCNSVTECSTSFTLERNGSNPDTRYHIKEVLLSPDGHLSITLRDRPFREVLDGLSLYVRDMRMSYGDWCENVQRRRTNLPGQLLPPISDPRYFSVGDAVRSNSNKTITFRNTGLVWFTLEDGNEGQTTRNIMPKTEIGFTKEDGSDVAETSPIRGCPLVEYNRYIRELERGVVPIIREQFIPQRLSGLQVPDPDQLQRQVPQVPPENTPRERLPGTSGEPSAVLVRDIGTPQDPPRDNPPEDGSPQPQRQTLSEDREPDTDRQQRTPSEEQPRVIIVRDTRSSERDPQPQRQATPEGQDPDTDRQQQTPPEEQPRVILVRDTRSSEQPPQPQRQATPEGQDPDSNRRPLSGRVLSEQPRPNTPLSDGSEPQEQSTTTPPPEEDTEESSQEGGEGEEEQKASTVRSIARYLQSIVSDIFSFLTK